MRKKCTALTLVATYILAFVAGSQAIDTGTTNNDFDWVLIGDPGNPGLQDVGGYTYLLGRGKVDYYYRLTRTEITVTQWFEFVQAYAPYYEGTYGQSFGLTGSFINISGPLTDPDSYYIIEGTENFPANQSWRMSARYCNWLHNDKQLTQEAFASGAYDTSTFTENEDGSFNDQATRSPGAKFWIPSLDEWIKGVYYDPRPALVTNYWGNWWWQSTYSGWGIWWRHPASSDEALTAGLLHEGGQTNGSLFWYLPDIPLETLEIGSYSDIQSPWGLLDASGGMQEWTEEMANNLHTRRMTKGSSFFSDVFTYQWEDGILHWLHGPANGTTMQGLRLAAEVSLLKNYPIFRGDAKISTTDLAVMICVLE